MPCVDVSFFLFFLNESHFGEHLLPEFWYPDIATVNVMAHVFLCVCVQVWVSVRLKDDPEWACYCHVSSLQLGPLHPDLQGCLSSSFVLRLVRFCHSWDKIIVWCGLSF